MSGKNMRIKQLFQHSDKLLVVPMDHGITLGPVQGLTDMEKIMGSLKGKADAVVVHKGLAKQIADAYTPQGCQLIVHLSASTALAPDPNRKELVTSVEHAIQIGATAVSTHVNLGSDTESEMLKDMGAVAECCATWGIPLLAMMYVRDGSKANEYNPQMIAHAARVAEELGADIIKVNYTGDPNSFAEVTEGVKAPVIIAGGPKVNSIYDLLKMVADSIKAGGKGAAIGRNVFQDPNPTLLADALRYVLDQPVTDDQLKELVRKM